MEMDACDGYGAYNLTDKSATKEITIATLFKSVQAQKVHVEESEARFANEYGPEVPPDDDTGNMQFASLTEWALSGRGDPYRGSTLSTSTLERVAPDEWRKALPSLLDLWKEHKIRTVWIKVLKEHAVLIPVLVEKGFEYHHAQRQYLMVTRSVPGATSPANLPLYPYTQIGVGGLTVDEKGRFLMMREKMGPYLGYKFPGGLADPGETIYEAAMREVFEETNVDTEPVAILGFRQLRNIKFGIVCDVYFVVIMRPRPGGNHTPKQTTEEAAEVRWMSREELEGLSPYDHATQYLRTMLNAYDEWVAGGMRGLRGEDGTSKGRSMTTFFFDYSQREENGKANL